MGSLLAEDNKKAKANQNVSWLKKCVFMGLGEWNFCLKRLSTPTKTLPLLFETHTLTLNVGQKITNIQSTYHLFNAIILYFI
ncbi:hypothetical protein HPHPA11_0608 [Helicobacter pylori Hp A-11]|uniref:Uncharacterized protein n=1 Tax=Helicobacter pylori Hp A-11 TaxID=992035 RepID=N4TAI7_HELPX|nr:hypothetical protein HPHPA11_0608 [Helicobacter pylori Hp A-11]